MRPFYTGYTVLAGLVFWLLWAAPQLGAQPCGLDQCYVYPEFCPESIFVGGGEGPAQPAPDQNLIVAGVAITNGAPRRLAMSGNHAFVACANSFDVIDISDPVDPRLVTTVPVDGPVLAITCDAHFVYTIGAKLEVFDIRRLEQPLLLSTFTFGLGERPDNIAVTSNVLLLAGRSGLRLLDVSDRSNPKDIPNGFPYTGYSSAWTMEVEGTTAVVVRMTTGLSSDIPGVPPPQAIPSRVEAYDITNPLTPTLRWSVGFSIVTSVAIGNGVVYVGDAGGTYSRLYIHDVNTGAHVSSHADGFSPVLGVAGNYLFKAVDRAVVAFSTTNSVLANSSLSPVGGSAVDMVAAGPFAFVVISNATSGRLLVLRPGNTANPQVAGGYYVPGDPLHLEIHGAHRFIVDSPRWSNNGYFGGGIQILNSQGSWMGRVDGSFRRVRAAGQLAFAVGPAYGRQLNVIDIANPCNPQVIGGWGTGTSVQDIALAGDYAILADVAHGLHVLDITTAANPRQVHQLTGQYGRVIASNNYAFAAETEIQCLDLPDENEFPCKIETTGGLDVLDISNPKDVRFVGRYDAQGHIKGMAIAGDLLFLGVSSRANSTNAIAGLHVIDISAKARPRLIGIWNLFQDIGEILVVGDYAYVQADTFFTHVIDVRNPKSPRRVGGSQLAGGQMVLANCFVHVVTSGYVTLLHEYCQPRFESLSQVNGTTVIRFRGPPRVPAMVQRSDDLKVWSNWSAVRFIDGPMVLPDEVSTTGGAFYRLILP